MESNTRLQSLHLKHLRCQGCKTSHSLFKGGKVEKSLLSVHCTSLCQSEINLVFVSSYSALEFSGINLSISNISRINFN